MAKKGNAFDRFNGERENWTSTRQRQARPGWRPSKKLCLIVICVVAAALICAGTLHVYNRLTAPDYSNVQNPIVTIEMEGGDTIKLELYPAIAPITVANFVDLAQSGYYDGLIFHRVIAGFVIQGGDPNGDGTGGPGFSIKGEFSANGVKNELSHSRGVVSMARSQSYDSAGSQFFIMHADRTSLDGQYAAFGKVIEGQDIVDEIATTKTDSSDKPLTEWKMKKVTVETFGYEYSPERIQ